MHYALIVGEGMSKSRKIFVVDDDSIVLSALQMLLEIEGFLDVTYFDNPKIALEALKTTTPDLILSDFIMPQMNGIEFLSAAKEFCPDISMILLTGYADKENAIKSINEVGIYKYIEKPWDNADLIINIKNGIERSNLISELNIKIEELSQAKSELERYSHSLEEIVKEKTKNLVESNTKLSAVIHFCADGIILVSKEGYILQANPAFENLTGLSQGLLQGKHIKEYLVLASDVLNKIDNESEVLIRDIEVKNCINDRTIPVEISFAPVLTENHVDGTHVGVVRNVSLQKEMDRLRDDFIATLTHDLRTPLLAAIQTLQFFLDGSLGDVEARQKTLLDTMKKSNEDMLGLVNALLEVYKYESGKLNLCYTDFCLKDFVEECLSQINALAEKKQITINTNFSDIEDTTIYADRKELRRVVMNLCGNALNHTQENGKIEVSANSQDSNLIINVKDNGIGIPKSDLSKLFKRFSQGTTQKRSAGTGLGLYLSRQIVEAHGGKIWAESEISKGSVFSVMIPDALKKTQTTQPHH